MCVSVFACMCVYVCVSLDWSSPWPRSYSYLNPKCTAQFLVYGQKVLNKFLQNKQMTGRKEQIKVLLTGLT